MMDNVDMGFVGGFGRSWVREMRRKGRGGCSLGEGRGWVEPRRRNRRAWLGMTMEETRPEVMTGLDEHWKMAQERIDAVSTEVELNEIRVEYLGKKGKVTSVLKMLGSLSSEERPRVGARVNEIKVELEGLLAEKKEKLEEDAMAARLREETIDVTIPGIQNDQIGNLHPLTQTMMKAVDIFVDLGYELVDSLELSPEIETDYYNFQALNIPPDHPARDMQDTFYLSDDMQSLLRTHTSSVQIRYMEKNKPPFAIVCPGRVYRRDSVDATHSALFHQVEIMAIGKDFNLGNLRATIIHFLKCMFGDDIEVRFRGSYFPFTEPSMEVDVFFRGRWLEVLGCGMVDPSVLEMAGLDPDEWQGFAAGFGIERFAMVIHEIPDIREFYKNDLRFLSQFSDPHGML